MHTDTYHIAAVETGNSTFDVHTSDSPIDFALVGVFGACERTAKKYYDFTRFWQDQYSHPVLIIKKQCRICDMEKRHQGRANPNLLNFDGVSNILLPAKKPTAHTLNDIKSGLMALKPLTS
jgi:hypothetical protein